MLYASEAIAKLLRSGLSQSEIATSVGVTDAMVSVWKNKKNDFCPRIDVAKKFFTNHGLQLYPYHKDALDGTA